MMRALDRWWWALGVLMPLIVIEPVVKAQMSWQPKLVIAAVIVAGWVALCMPFRRMWRMALREAEAEDAQRPTIASLHKQVAAQQRVILQLEATLVGMRREAAVTEKEKALMDRLAVESSRFREDLLRMREELK